MLSRLSSILVLAACAALSACAGAQPRPAWVTALGSAPAASLEGVGLAGYRSADPQAVKDARDVAYSDALQKLSLKLRAVVRGEVRTSLTARVRNGSEDVEQTVESLTGSVFSSVLGSKRFEEFRDERRREYWVRCSMSQEEADAAIRAALAAAERERELKTVSIRVSGAAPALLALAEAELKSPFGERGFTVLPEAQAAAARIAVSGELSTEDLGSLHLEGMEMGRSCRARLLPQALLRGPAGPRVVLGRTAQGATGVGRTPAEACEKAVRRAAAQAAAALLDAVSRAAAE